MTIQEASKIIMPLTAIFKQRRAPDVYVLAYLCASGTSTRADSMIADSTFNSKTIYQSIEYLKQKGLVKRYGGGYALAVGGVKLMQEWECIINGELKNESNDQPI